MAKLRNSLPQDVEAAINVYKLKGSLEKFVCH